MTTQIKGSQIQDGTISSADIDDSLEKDFTKIRASTDDSTPGFLGSKLTAGSNVTITLTGDAGTNQSLTINSSGGSPGGSQGEVQYCDAGGAFTGSSGLVFDAAAGSLTTTNLSVSENLTAIGQVAMMSEVLMMSNFEAASSGSISGSLAVGADFSVTGMSTVLGPAAFINSVTAMSDVEVAGNTTISGILSYNALPVDKFTSSGDLTDGHHFIVADTSSGAIDITLPSVSVSTGRTYVIKRSGSNVTNILVHSSDVGAANIDGASSLSLTTNLQVARIFCDGADWWMW